MSQANIPNIIPTISLTTAQTIPLLLASIALEELSLAHIMNAEAEKLQFVLGTITPAPTTALAETSVSLSNLLAIDSSVQRTLRDVIKKEMLLEFKFENVLDLIASGAAAVTPPPPAVCGCGVSLGTGVTTGPIIVTTVLGTVTVPSVALDFGICASCSPAGSFFDLGFGLVPIVFTLDTIASVTCTGSVATIMGTASVTIDGLPSITGDVTIIVNGPAGTVTVTVTSGATTLLSLTIPVPSADIVFNTCP